MKLDDFINDVNYCVAAKVFIPRLDYEIVLEAINYDDLIEVITELKHFNKGCMVSDICYYD